MKNRLPIFLDLEGRRVLVAGGGLAAARKLPSLLKAGACITLIAPRICPAVRRLLRPRQDAVLIKRAASVKDVTESFSLLFPLTDSPRVNRQLTLAARAARVWTAGCSDRENSDFHMGAVVESGTVRLAISTGGQSPALARKLARQLREVVPDLLARGLQKN